MFECRVYGMPPSIMHLSVCSEVCAPPPFYEKVEKSGVLHSGLGCSRKKVAPQRYSLTPWVATGTRHGYASCPDKGRPGGPLGMGRGGNRPRSSRGALPSR
jgi:hypothetical protein